MTTLLTLGQLLFIFVVALPLLTLFVPEIHNVGLLLYLILIVYAYRVIYGSYPFVKTVKQLSVPIRGNQQKGTCYVCHPIEEFVSKTDDQIEIRPYIQTIQSESNQKMNTHSTRLNEWDENTKHLQQQFMKHNTESSQTLCEEQGKLLDVSTLYLSYKDCMQLLQEEQQRTEDVMAYCMDLHTETKQLRSRINMYNNDIPTTKNKHDDLCEKHNALKQKRESLQDKVKNMVIEINNLIEEENKTNHEKCITLDTYNSLQIELTEYEKLLTVSRSLTNRYSEFEGNVEQKTEELNKYFKSKWDEDERNWREWDAKDIVFWFKYLIHGKKLRLSNDFNIEIVEEKMNEDKISGTSLNILDRNDLKSLGFTTFDDRFEAYKAIRMLIEKYPGSVKDESFPSDDEASAADNDQSEGKNTRCQVPKEYLCPISGKIMEDPVIAYDNKTYEKTNIIEYIKKHKHAPNCEIACDENEPVLRNTQLKAKIDQFLCVNTNI